MNLFARLTSAFLMLAVLLAVVGLVAVRAQHQVEYQLSQLARSSVLEVRHATSMALELQRAKTAAEELVTELYLLEAEPATHFGQRPPAIVEVDLREALAAFRQELAQSRDVTYLALQLADQAASEGAVASERGEFESWLDPLVSEATVLDRQSEEFLRLAAADAAAAHRYLNQVYGPHFRERLLPLVEGYRSDASDELLEELDRISSIASAAARSGLLLGVGAVVLALLLGLVVSRSIARPLAALSHAAESLGAGDLSSRAPTTARGEVGQLAATFNRMAEELSATTVSRTYLSKVIESMSGALVMTDVEARIVGVNQASVGLLGCGTESALQGQPLERFFPGVGGDGEDSAISNLRSSAAPCTFEETLRRPDGSETTVAMSGAALTDRRGALEGFVFVAQDLTERKRVEARLQALLREVNHRVKNNLQVVSSLLDLQAGYLSDAGARAALLETRGRIESMALVHEQLGWDPETDDVDIEAYLRRLTERVVHGHRPGGDNVILRLAIAPERLTIDRALACGLIVNELLTNALKHAFPARTTGEIRLELLAGRDGRMTLVVADDGVGLAADFDPRRIDSLGLNLVTTMVDELGGEMEVVGGDGTEVRIVFPRVEGVRARREESVRAG